MATVYAARGKRCPEGVNAHHCDDHEALLEAEGRESPETETPAEPKGRLVDLMSALQDSVRAPKKSRGESGGESEVREIRPKTNTPAKKQAGKKTAKKAPAKKTARKRSAS
ncbi:hypothetical protein ACH4TX_19320 [Streptomyces sp. NPDC021098]|uniref:hypothetical protein n=1 Tax=unclassified Streptomyces TaxID=2593676 RepID=UPI0037A34829